MNGNPQQKPNSAHNKSGKTAAGKSQSGKLAEHTHSHTQKNKHTQKANKENAAKLLMLATALCSSLLSARALLTGKSSCILSQPKSTEGTELVHLLALIALLSQLLHSSDAFDLCVCSSFFFWLLHSLIFGQKGISPRAAILPFPL